jgi:hypothetical protein
MFRRICHRAVALAVAYAVALNLLVPFLAALASAAQAMPATFAEICATDQGSAASGGERRDRHAPECPLGPACLTQDCGPNGFPALGSETAATFALEPTAVLLYPRLDDERLLRRVIFARFARAPPQA